MLEKANIQLRGGHGRTKRIRESNLPRISELDLQGHTDLEITQIINDENREKYNCYPISLWAIRADLRECRKRWAHTIIWTQNEMRRQSVALIRRMQKEAMIAWEKSKETVRRTISKLDAETQQRIGPITLMQESHWGDTRCLDTVLRLEQEINRLYGLYPDAPIDQEGSKANKVSLKVVLNTQGKTLEEVTNFPIIEEPLQLPPSRNGGDDDDEDDGDGDNNGA